MTEQEIISQAEVKLKEKFANFGTQNAVSIKDGDLTYWVVFKRQENGPGQYSNWTFEKIRADSPIG